VKSEENDILKDLYIRNYAKMKLVAKKSLSNLEQAEDVVQDTFLVAQEKIEDLITSPKPEGWLMQTLRNIIGDFYRRQKRLLNIYTSIDNEQIPSKIKVNLHLEYEGTIDKEDFNLLIWVYCDGLKYDEVAKKLGISLSACKKRIQRAKLNFKKALMT